MASYNSAPVNFSPYVAQRPAGLMLKVGMEKEKLYQQGYERIQSSIDKVAGLDVYRDVDKGYLQQKINKLSTDLQGVAAGDFSDFQLTNSVAGMANEISNDEYVQAAVQSTAKIRNESNRIKALESKGLTDANNDAYYNAELGGYLNNDQLKDANGKPISFNGSYTPYTNIIGKMKEALKDAGEDENIAEQLFVTENGKPVRDKRTGEFIYADVKTIEKLTSNKEAVLAAISTVFDQGDVKQQLHIDGWAKYRGTDVNSMLSKYDDMHAEVLTRINSSATQINNLLSATNISDADKALYTKQLEQLEAARITTNSNYLTTKQSAIENPDAFKERYHEADYKNNIQKLFTKEKRSETTGVNEGKQQQNWQQTFNFNAQKEANEVRARNAAQSLAERKFGLELKEFDVKYPIVNGHRVIAKASDARGEDGVLGQELTFTGDQAGAPVNVSQIMETRVANLSSQKGQQALAIFAEASRSLDDDPSKPLAKIKSELAGAAKARGVSVDSYLNDFVINAYNNYDKMGLKPSPALNEKIIQYKRTATALTDNITTKEQALKSAYKLAGVDKEFQNFRAKPGIQFNLDGKVYKLSPEDALDLSLKQRLTTDIVGDAKQAEYNRVNKGYTPAQLAFLKARLTLPATVTNAMGKHYYELISQSDKVIATRKRAGELYNTELGKHITVPGSITGTINIDKGEYKWGNANLIAAYVNRGDLVSTKDGQSKDDVLSALAPDKIKSISYKGLEPDPDSGKVDWDGQIIISSDAGTVTLTGISQEDLQTLTGKRFNPKINRPISKLIASSPTGSTNLSNYPSSPKAWSTAYLQSGTHESELKNAGYVHRADVIQTASGFQLAHYIKPPGSESFSVIYDNLISPSEENMRDLYEGYTVADVKALYSNYKKQQQKK